jgi:hypothetical protein
MRPSLTLCAGLVLGALVTALSPAPADAVDAPAARRYYLEVAGLG